LKGTRYLQLVNQNDSDVTFSVLRRIYKQFNNSMVSLSKQHLSIRNQSRTWLDKENISFQLEAFWSFIFSKEANRATFSVN